MIIAELFVLSYVLSCIVGYVLLRAAMPGNRQVRRWFFVAVLSLPIVAPVSLFAALFSRQDRRVARYHDGLGRVEDEIEAERVDLFGEHRLTPSFSERWKESWLRSVEKVVECGRPSVPAHMAETSGQLLSCESR